MILFVYLADDVVIVWCEIDFFLFTFIFDDRTFTILILWNNEFCVFINIKFKAIISVKKLELNKFFGSSLTKAGLKNFKSRWFNLLYKN